MAGWPNEQGLRASSYPFPVNPWQPLFPPPPCTHLGSTLGLSLSAAQAGTDCQGSPDPIPTGLTGYEAWSR